MALSDQFVEAHIAAWRVNLARTFYTFTAKWPNYIFRHDPIQNLAQVLERGELLSRTDSIGVRVVDVAAAEIVNNNDHAHSKVRMYFRPRNPTQYRIEGVMRPIERYHDAHASMLAMMIFDATKILTSEGVEFSTCNMQRAEVETGSSQKFFEQELDFRRIYHFGPHRDDLITARRCAEVLLPSPFRIEAGLKRIVCRSEAERETLIDSLSPEAKEKWREKIVSADPLRLFERKYAFVERVYLQHDGLVAKFSPRHDGGAIKLRVKCTLLHDQTIKFESVYNPIATSPPEANQLWRFPFEVEPGQYLVELWIEDCVSYSAVCEYTEAPF